LWPRYAGDLGGIWVGGGPTVGFASAQVRFANGMKVEALEPNLVERNDFLRRFLDHSGPGPHHLTFKVTDIEMAIAKTEEAGYRPVGVDLSEPQWKEAFLHPKDAPGVVVQLAQSKGDWDEAPRPASLPSPRTDPPASLIHVAHCVASMDEALKLFAGLLGGAEQDRGSSEAFGGSEWVDLAWPGAGVLRLISPARPDNAPTRADNALAHWLGGRSGRIHHLHFACSRPRELAGAKPASGTDGRDPCFEVTPEDNFGVRLLLDDAGT
ncbi:MAG: VOC family protein, partial [Acidimicrobiales bacterium]